jgi:CheY-like chemotaxis protein
MSLSPAPHPASYPSRPHAPAPAPAAVPGALPRSHELLDVPSLRILLAHGNGPLRRLLSLLLRRDGHRVGEARDAATMLEAVAFRLARADEAAFDAIISEQDLPGATGTAVLAGLRSSGVGTPFILMTDARDIQVRARLLGAVILDGHLTLRSLREAVLAAAPTAEPRADPRFPFMVSGAGSGDGT